MNIITQEAKKRQAVVKLANIFTVDLSTIIDKSTSFLAKFPETIEIRLEL